MKDKFSAVWISHSSISSYLKCPRAYYLQNIYRDPKTKHKITIIQPPLALGQAVHTTLEALSLLPVEERFKESLLSKFEKAWENVSGKWGGFTDGEEEELYKERGRAMIKRVTDNPGPLMRKAIKIRQELPYYWISEEDNIILCGKIDWLEYLPETDSVSIVDFKTGKYDEDGDSLQLPIYYLIVTNCQKRKATKACYWYLDRDPEPKEVPLPDEFEAFEKIMTIAKKIKVARKLDSFNCPNPESCMVCKPYEKIIKGEAVYVGVNDHNADVYYIPNDTFEGSQDAINKFAEVPEDEPF